MTSVFYNGVPVSRSASASCCDSSSPVASPRRWRWPHANLLVSLVFIILVIVGDRRTRSCRTINKPHASHSAAAANTTAPNTTTTATTSPSSASSCPEFQVPQAEEWEQCSISDHGKNQTGDDDDCFTDETSSILDLCDDEVAVRLEQAREPLPLSFCSFMPLKNIRGAPTCLNESEPTECKKCLRNIITNDQRIAYIFSLFEKIIYRYDCNKTFSIMSSCEECKERYKQWLCATELEYYEEDEGGGGQGSRVKPCLQMCHLAAAKCPYLLPFEPYAGEPVFFCPDKKTAYREKASYAAEPNCFNCGVVGTNDWEEPCIFERFNQTAWASSSAAAPVDPPTPLTNLMIPVLLAACLAGSGFT